MLELLKILLLFNILICSSSVKVPAEGVELKDLLQWPNATVPFYIDSQHFDHEQTVAIMTALTTFAFKTCLKFAPVMEMPKEDQHVLVFVNPDGVRRCKIDTKGHSVFSPHTVHLGYECLKSPYIEMMIMRALGFPFEHNRMVRDLYINVQLENIEPGAVELFTKDIALPDELRAQPYDIDSVMHFGQRDFSKNGHRTFTFKAHNIQQNRVGLSARDIKKIQIVYGPECQQRERQEKVDICQSYPGVVRRKRDIEIPSTPKNLRVNRDITPPSSLVEGKPDNDKKDPEELESDVSKNLKELGIEDEAQEILDRVNKISSKALKNAREKYCNSSKVYQSIVFDKSETRHNSDLIGILEYIVMYTDSMVSNAMLNLTVFCQNPDSIAVYARQVCNWRFDSRCVPTYRSTKSGAVRYSTNHRPIIPQSTKHRGQAASYSYDKVAWRARNDSDEVTTPKMEVRKKREIHTGKLPSKELQENIQEKDRHIKGNLTSEDLRRDGRSYSKSKLNSREYSKNVPSDSAASRISGEEDGKGLSLPEVIRDPPSLAAKSSKAGMANGRQTHFFGEIKNKAVPVLDNTAKENDYIDGETSSGGETERLKKIKDKFRDSHKSREERIKKKAERLEQTSRNSIHKERIHKEIPPTIELSKLSKEFYNERRWPEGVIRYVVSPLEGYDLDDMRSRLAEVTDILKKKTCARLVEVSEEEAKNYEDYLVLDTSPDYVTGRVGGKQHFGCVELFKGGQHRQHAAMMVMAMLGFYFEVARHDRDKYIRVHMRHVRPDKLHHFEKIRDEATLDLPYDFKSATHPAWQFWRKIGKTGISTVATFKTLDPDGSVMRSLGQYEQLLSDSDIIKINSIYGVECFTEEDSSDDRQL